MAGYTERVYQLIDVFEDIHRDHFIRVTSSKNLSLEEKIWDACLDTQFVHGQVVAIDVLPRVTPKFTGGDIVLKNVPIVAPSGDVVCPSLTIKVCAN